MKMRTPALTLLFTLSAVSWPARSANAAPPPVCAKEPTFSIVPLDDNQFVMMVNTAAASAECAAGPKVLIGKIRRPSGCSQPWPLQSVAPADVCDPATDPTCTCDAGATWNALISKIRRPSNCSQPGPPQSVVAEDVCDPQTDPSCTCDVGAAPGHVVEDAAWRAIITKIRRPAQCSCDLASQPDCTCGDVAAWTVLIGKIRRTTSCLCNVDAVQEPSCVCTEDRSAPAPIATITRSTVPAAQQ